MNRRWFVSLTAGVLVGLALPAPLESAEADAPTTREMKLITWTEFREWVPRRIQTVLVPIGSIEAHGVIPNGSDAIAPTAMAEAIAPRLGAMVVPPLSYGVTPGLQAYPGAVSITPATFDAYLAYMQAIVPEHIHPERYREEMAMPSLPSSAFYAVPSPASIGLYNAGEGYPASDAEQAKVYFEKVNDEVARIVEDTIARWDRAGLYAEAAPESR